MSDRFSAMIRIGGQVSRAVRLYPDDDSDDDTIIQGLMGALHADGASNEFGGVVIPAGCDSLRGYFDPDENVLIFKHDEAVNGEFPDTEQFCIEHDIPYDRWSDHYGDYDGENVSFRAGMNAPLVTYADSRGKEIVDGETIREALTELIRFNTQRQEEQLLGAMRLLEAACPDLPDSLPKFEIVD